MPPAVDRRSTTNTIRLEIAFLLTGKAACRGIAKISGDFIAFRIPERSENHTNLNADSDIRDLVVNVYDASTGTTTSTGRARCSSRALFGLGGVMCAQRGGHDFH